MGVEAEPYVTYFGTFDYVLSNFLNMGATTTASTTVAAADEPTQRTLVLASATGFAAGATIYVDVLPQQERSVVQSISGSSIVCHLTKAHVGTYQITVDGGEAIVREILINLYDNRTKTAAASNTAGIKQVDEIHFFGGSSKSSQASALFQIRDEMRDELASALGVVNMWRVRHGQGQSVSVY